jgi:hypothetical protein
MLLQAGPNGNVFAYNYSTNPFWTEFFVPSNSAADIVLHGNYPFANLFEGNIASQIIVDNSHGANGPLNTFFRNRINLYGLNLNNGNQQNFLGNEMTNYPASGNWNVSGTNHLMHANNVLNNTGSYVVRDAGTSSLPEASLYYNAKPNYLNSINAWPVIGLNQNTPNAYVNAAYNRFASSEKTICISNAVLAIAKLNFSLAKKDCSINLKFSIKDISNIKKFNIEKADENHVFKTIKTILPNNYVLQNYTYNYEYDDNNATNKNYYRIITIEKNNEQNFSTILSETVPCSAITIYPTVFSNEIFINNIAKNSVVEIWDCNKKIVLRNKISINSVKLNLTNLPANAYLVRILFDGALVFKKSIIKL